MEQLQDAYDEAARFPSNLLRSDVPVPYLDSTRDELRLQADRLFCKSETEAAVNISQRETIEREAQLKSIRNSDDLEKTLLMPYKRTADPLLRMIFITAPSSRSRLNITPSMAQNLFAYHQVTPAELSTRLGRLQAESYGDLRVLDPGVLPKRINRSSTLTDSICRGRLNGRSEDVFVDSQAENFISEFYLKSRGIPWNKSSTQTVKVADGHKYETLGEVSMPWKFAGDRKKHEVDFSVLPDSLCDYAVTFGGVFMRSIEKFKRWKRWILNVPRKSCMPRVRFQGSGQLRINGWCDGRLVSASPDCASDVPLMSPEFAKGLGESIDTSQDCCISLELPGNRIVKTAGMVRDVHWSLGDRDYSLDFYILEGLPVEVLLDKQFLDDANVFESHAESFYVMKEIGSGPRDGLFLNIKRMITTESHGSAHRFSERVIALFKRQPPSAPQEDPRQEFYARKKILVDRQRAVKKSNMSADEKKAETERIDEEWKLLQQKRPPNKSTGSTSNSQSQSASPVPGSTNGGPK